MYECRHRTRGLARNCPRLFIGVFIFLIQMASFTCRVLLFGSLLILFASSQSVMWFSIVAWSVKADLLKLEISLFPRSWGILIVRVVYGLAGYLQYTRHHSSCMVSGPPAHLVLQALPCLLDVPTGV